MKQLANWTFGAFFRALGRFLFFVVLGGFFALIIAKSGLRLPDWLKPIFIVKADSVSYNYSQYRTQYYQLSSGTSAWNSWTNFGTSTALSNGYGVSTIAFRFGLSQKFQPNTNYRVVIEVGYSPSSTIDDTFVNVEFPISCAGSSTSSWSSDTSLIESCTYLGAIKVSGTNHVKYVIDVVPTLAIYGFQFNLSFVGTSEVSSLRAHTSSEILTGNDVGSVIEEQTLIIQDGFTDITNIINQTNEDLINAITESNTTCETITISKNISNILAGSLATACTRAASSSAYVTDYIRVNNLSNISVLRNSSYCFYDNSKTPIGSKSTYTSGTLTIPQNASYVRVQFSQSGSYEYANIKTCMSNTESTNNKLDDINNLLGDTDTTSDTNTLADDMRDFNLSIEGPLTAILNIPIQLLDDLLVDYNSTNTHADLCFTLKGVESCIPSGDILWKRTARSGVHDNDYVPYWFGIPDFVAFRQFFELVVGGYLIYLLLKKLVNEIEKGLDPTINEVKIMKL